MDVSEEWEFIYGNRFMRKIGVQEGDIVLDLGCNIGRYSIVLAQIVGKNGRVYAVDNDRNLLTKFKKRIKNTDYTNIIEIIYTNKIPDSIKEDSVDFVLLYDILHYLERKERAFLYQDIHTILKSASGMLTIHPKHTKEDDFPSWNLKNLTITDVVSEIESFGFLYEKKICDILWHRDGLEKSCVYNFRKKTA